MYCSSCGFPLQQVMFGEFEPQCEVDGKKMVCTNPFCPLGEKNAPKSEPEEQIL